MGQKDVDNGEDRGAATNDQLNDEQNRSDLASDPQDIWNEIQESKATGNMPSAGEDRGDERSQVETGERREAQQRTSEQPTNDGPKRTDAAPGASAATAADARGSDSDRQEPAKAGDQSLKDEMPASICGASKEVQELWLKQENALRSATGRAQSFQKRYEAMQRMPVSPAPSQQQQPPAPSPEKKGDAGRTQTPAPSDVLKQLDSIEEDYPEIANPLREILGDVNKRIDQLNEAETRRFGALVDREQTVLASQHPDWFATIKDNAEEFRNWLDDQPKRIRDAEMINRQHIVAGDLAAEMVGAFKQHLAGNGAGEKETASQPGNQETEQKDSRRKRQLAGSSAPSGNGGLPVVTGIQKDGDGETIWNQIQAEKTRRATTAA